MRKNVFGYTTGNAEGAEHQIKYIWILPWYRSSSSVVKDNWKRKTKKKQSVSKQCIILCHVSPEMDGAYESQLHNTAHYFVTCTVYPRTTEKMCQVTNYLYNRDGVPFPDDEKSACRRLAAQEWSLFRAFWLAIIFHPEGACSQLEMQMSGNQSEASSYKELQKRKEKIQTPIQLQAGQGVVKRVAIFRSR